MEKKILYIIMLLFCTISFAQDMELWSNGVIIPKTTISDNWNKVKVANKILNLKALKTLVTTIKQTGTSKISIPHPTKGEMTFFIQPTHLMAPALAAKYPEIKTFKGKNSTGDQIRIDINPNGLFATVYTKKGTIYIEPESNGDLQYRSYFSSDYQKSKEEAIPPCGTSEHTAKLTRSSLSKAASTSFRKRTIGDQLRKFRIAITSHPSFTTATGGGTNTMSAIITILNRVTGIFERDVAITFELVANNDLLIVTSSNPDPFVLREPNGTVESVFTMRPKNADFVNSKIGENSYDLGHIFAANNGGGIAGFEGVCKARKKANSVTSIKFRGTNYTTFIEYLAHEIGHQFGALHTFNSPSCAIDSQFNLRASYEIGSGNTIMSYASTSACAGNKTQSRVDEYFHAISIENILHFTETQASCVEVIATNNNAPIVSVPNGGFTIPINTPFVLEATASDANGDELTYSWEQFDQTVKRENTPGVPFSSISGIGYFTIEEFLNSDEYETREELEAVETPAGPIPEEIIKRILSRQQSYIDIFFEGDGPLFKNFAPTTEPKRYFPQLSKILAGQTSIRDSRFEVLPFKTRNLNFVVTVRDNNPTVGGMTNQQISFASTEQAGPFTVTTEFTEPVYNGNSTIALQWDVANTNTAPVNCQKVTILYSTNGGENFDIILSENTDNDGLENIKLPNIETSQARIMVKAANNIFFNVNSTNFSVSRSNEEVVLIAPKLYLQGATVNPVAGEETLMRDDLDRAALIPTTSPYSDAVKRVFIDIPNVVASNNLIVDWVFVQLRDATDNTIVVAEQSALLQRDGDVVATDGVSSLTFTVDAGDYFIVINHRNHLGVITAEAVSLSSTATTLDFTTNIGLIAGGNTAVAEVRTGVFGLITGEVNSDGLISISDINTLTQGLGSSGYSNSDLNMDSQILFSDSALVNQNLGSGEQFSTTVDE